jgi:hypothetical protein
MHKGYKCLDRSTGQIYISRDVVFDETVFSFSTPSVSVNVSTLKQSITFPSDEPVTSAPMQKYDLSYLSTDPPSSGVAFPSQAIAVLETSPGHAAVAPCLHAIDVLAPGMPPIAPYMHGMDVHGMPMRGTPPEDASCSSSLAPSFGAAGVDGV